MADLVALARDGGVATITLNRPEKRNALSIELRRELAEAFRSVSADEAVAAVVLTGAGSAFCAGMDTSQFGGDEANRRALFDTTAEVFASLRAVPVPTVAAVNGPALGGGLVLAAACDLRVCTPDARLGMPIARTVGNCLSVANHARLVAHLGPSRVQALVMSASFLDAEEARSSGFVLEVAAPADLDAKLAALCERVAGQAPITLRVTKEAVRRVLAAQRPDDDEELLRAAYGSQDFREGVSAFLEKREPRWQGR